MTASKHRETAERIADRIFHGLKLSILNKPSVIEAVERELAAASPDAAGEWNRTNESLPTSDRDGKWHAVCNHGQKASARRVWDDQARSWLFFPGGARECADAYDLWMPDDIPAPPPAPLSEAESRSKAVEMLKELKLATSQVVQLPDSRIRAAIDDVIAVLTGEGD